MTKKTDNHRSNTRETFKGKVGRYMKIGLSGTALFAVLSCSGPKESELTKLSKKYDAAIENIKTQEKEAKDATDARIKAEEKETKEKQDVIDAKKTAEDLKKEIEKMKISLEAQE